MQEEQEHTGSFGGGDVEAPVGLAAEAARKKLDDAFDPTTARDYVKPSGVEDKAMRGPKAKS
jgi:hypothetical protein